ncbi:hypothetical protein TNCV_3081351 [Trichonephila clavipes]|nr:hypothetical protein TNCV_3081351 [Trichonephila clavipes]
MSIKERLASVNMSKSISTVVINIVDVTNISATTFVRRMPINQRIKHASKKKDFEDDLMFGDRLSHAFKRNEQLRNHIKEKNSSRND